MNRAATIFIGLLLAAASLGLYQTKYRIESLKHDLASIRNAIWVEQDAIHVLQAEWAYLNRPQRLAELSTKFLSSLGPVLPSQIVTINELPLKEEREGASARTPP